MNVAQAAVRAAVLLLLLAGCDRRLRSIVVPNQPPEVRISHEILPPGSLDVLRHQVHWTGLDHDGRVNHYLVAVNPASVDCLDKSWRKTTETGRVITFALPEKSRAGTSPEAEPSPREPHILAVRAVDDQGSVSPPAWTAFFPGNLPPIVTILSPRPSSLATPTLGRDVRIVWEGTDPDGQFTTRPWKYKYILLSSISEFPIDLAVINPDSLRRFYAPAFVGWDSTGADTTEVRYQNLTVGQTYLFVVTAFDEAGDYDPVFSLNKNMLRFRVGFPKTLGPRLTLFSENFEFTYLTGGYVNDSSRYVHVTVPADQPLTFHWFAEPSPAADVAGYRWVLDPVDLYDERTRSTPDDVHHWSERSLSNGVTLAPFAAGPKGTWHLLYIEAVDSNGFRSLGIVNFFVVSILPGRDLLIVDDTRMRPERILSSGAVQPQGGWPNAAELDSFLYARGGFPWRGYPAGTLSEPGLFAGYEFDTLGTRIGRSDLSVPFATLARYRHVVWLVDAVSASYSGPGTHPTTPMTALQYMTSPGRENPLAAYVQGGGKLWMAGGGAAYASTIAWDDPSNNSPTTVFSSLSPRRELVPGRFMYDIARWRSEIRTSLSLVRITRFAGRFEETPRYGMLPAAMEPKIAATDPLPPLRTAASGFYRTEFGIDFLQRPNPIVEDLDPGPALDEQSTLDTLFKAAGPALPRPFPDDPSFQYTTMTLYHGLHGPPVIYTGFDLWSFRRAQCAQLVDFVLQGIWGLARGPLARVEPVGKREAIATREPPGGRTESSPP